jgi:threonine/homoserine/homoserine lactone efflux protein
MGQAIGQMLPFAIGIAISPIPIVAIVLMLGTENAKSDSLSFLVGWIVAMTAVGAILLAVVGSSNPTDNGAPADWSSTLKLVLGIVLLGLAVKQWRNRPQPGEDAEMPKWMDAVEEFTPVKSAGLGVVVSVVNPKNLILIIGGATAISQTNAAGSDQAIAWAVFILIATIGVAAPVVIYFAMGDKADAVLDDLKGWMARHNGAIMAVIFVIIGVKMIGDAITGLST